MIKDTYKNILVIICGFLALAFFFLNKGLMPKGQFFLAIGLGIGILSLLFPVLAQWIEIGWFKLSEKMGWVSSRIILSIVFYLFLMPIALLSRIFNKDVLLLRKTGKGLFIERNHQYNPKDLEFPW